MGVFPAGGGSGSGVGGFGLGVFPAGGGSAGSASGVGGFGLGIFRDFSRYAINLYRDSRRIPVFRSVLGCIRSILDAQGVVDNRQRTS